MYISVSQCNDGCDGSEEGAGGPQHDGAHDDGPGDGWGEHPGLPQEEERPQSGERRVMVMVIVRSH